MSEAGKLLVALGTLLVLAGAVLWALGRAGFRGLPGDLSFQAHGVRVYVPIVTCLVLSALLSLGLWLVQRLGR